MHWHPTYNHERTSTMICTFDLKQLMGETPPTLWERKAQAHNAAAREYGINIQGGRPFSPDGQYAQMAMDVTGSTRAGVLEFCRISHVVSVSIQPTDLPLYLSDFMLTAVRENFGNYQTTLSNLEPHEIVDTFDRIGAALWKQNPVIKNEPDPFYKETDEIRKAKLLTDETWLEMNNAELAREAEAAKPKLDMWGFHDGV
jgi:hypothetical protein